MQKASLKDSKNTLKHIYVLKNIFFIYCLKKTNKQTKKERLSMSSSEAIFHTGFCFTISITYIIMPKNCSATSTQHSYQVQALL